MESAANELGFAKALDAIVANMPSTRQTLLFSATQTQSVQSLARLSLQNPVIVSTDPSSATPDKLIEAYVECELEQKLDVLYSFIKTHLTEKVLVFMSSCKQVRYVYETFRRFRPGVPLMSLYGKQKQAKRVAIFNDFSKKKSAYLFATDIAARGLDFPAVDWVIQVDCPEDAETYIHRVGRTARYNKGGKAMLLLLPSEKPMIDALEKKKITLIKTDIASDKMKPIVPLLQSLCASDTELKYLAQKCFVSYMRSVYLQANKEVFKFDELRASECVCSVLQPSSLCYPVSANVEVPMTSSQQRYATALGLPSAPKIKFVQKKKSKARGAPEPAAAVAASERESEKGSKEVAKGEADSESSSDGSSDDDDADEDDADADGGGGGAAAAKPGKLKAARTTATVDAMRSRKNVDVFAPHRLKMRAVQDDDDDDGDDDFLVKSSAQTHDQLEALEDDHLTKKPANKKMEKRAKTIAALKKVTSSASERSHLKFTEDGGVVNERERLVGVDTNDLPAIKKALAKEHHDLKEAAMMLEKEDILDRAAEKQRLRDKKRDRKRKRKAAEQVYASDDDEGGVYAVLGSPDDDGEGDGAREEADEDGDGDEGDGSMDEQQQDLLADEDVAMRLLGM